MIQSANFKVPRVGLPTLHIEVKKKSGCLYVLRDSPVWKRIYKCIRISGLTSYGHNRKCRRKEPERFGLNPPHHATRLNA